MPHWVSDEAQLKKTWNNTLNARGETIFEKNSFRDSAKHKRCLIYVDGFYEHHHFKKDTFPYYIYPKSKEPMILAGLYSDWQDPKTGGKMTSFSIVTTTGNALLAKIHNNPKLKEPRMPVILPEALAEKWLIDLTDELDKKSLQELIHSYQADALEAYSVRQLRGKNGVGNEKEASEPYNYKGLPAL